MSITKYNTCPKCNGRKTITYWRQGGMYEGERPCKTCKGTGLVTRPTFLKHMRKRFENPIEQSKAINAVEIEEELDGPMPDTIWNMLSTREGAAEVMRANIRATKKNIIDRIKKL